MSGPPSRITRARRSAVARALAAVLAVATASALLVQTFDASLQGSRPGGERSSSFATGADGSGAYAELLERFDHRVERRRSPFTDGAIDPASTVVVLDPDLLTDGEAHTLRDFVDGGGRLVVGGASLTADLGLLLDVPPRASVTAQRVFDVGDGPGLGGVRRVTAGEGLVWSGTGDVDPLIAAGDDVLLARARAGDGEILLLADTSVLHNRLLATTDNAALGLALAGAPDAPVVFAEHLHGYHRSGGLGAIPSRWQVALVVLGVAAIAAMWTRGRRLGPPEDARRNLPPPRGAYVDALAVTMQRAGGRDEVAARVGAAVRARLAARGVLGPDAARDALYEQGRRAGLTGDEIRVVLDGAGDDDDLCTIGRALARVQGWGGEPRRSG